jgi:hypothetical protein
MRIRSPGAGFAAAPQLMKAWRYDPIAPEHVVCYGVALKTKLKYGAAYRVPAALLAVMTYDVNDMLSGFKPPA